MKEFTYKNGVSESSLVLTQDGWKSCDEIVIGDNLLTYNKDLDMLEWEPCLGVAIYDYDQDMQILENSDHRIVCTPNHLWITQRIIIKRKTRSSDYGGYHLEYPKFTRCVDFHSGQRIVAAAPIVPGGISILTPEQAQLLGWLVTDGYWRSKSHSPNCIEALIYQHPSKFLDEVITVAGGKPRKPHPDSGVIAVPVLQERVKPLKPYLDKSTLSKVVTRLSWEAATIMFDAMYKGDGTVSENRTSDFLACVNPGVREAAQILCFLLGKRTAVNFGNGFARGITIQKSRHVGIKDFKISLDFYSGRAWCPLTENSTWVMKQDRMITITGNPTVEYLL